MIDQLLFIELPWKLERAAPPFEGCDIKYPESLVRYFLKTYTKKGDKVFDPFIGLGTTAFVAEDLGRIPYGIEAERDRFEWVAGQLEHWQNIIHGDSGEIKEYSLPKMDFCMTSPPYMPCHHKWNPLYGGDPAYHGYEIYLQRMGDIFAQIATVMKRNSTLIVQADNLTGRRYTPLVRDLCLTIEPHFTLKAETIVRWQNPKPDYQHTHCLIFQKMK